MITLYHLYTIAGLVLALALVFRLFRCAHAWELVDKTEFDSICDQAEKSGHVLSNVTGLDQIMSVFSRTVCIVMRCPKCGAAKIFKLKS